MSRDPRPPGENGPVEERTWVVLLPVKAAAASKSRLQPAFDSPVRLADLVEAMRRDTVDAVRATPGVVAVVAAVDAPVSARALGPGVEVVVQTAPGLNSALRDADAYAALHHPESGRVAVVGDLPALTPSALRAVLTAAAGHARAFVPDLAGSGTTMLAVTEGPLDPAFGPGSAARHGRTAVALAAAGAARHDVDVEQDLRNPPPSGFGPATRAALATDAGGLRPGA